MANAPNEQNIGCPEPKSLTNVFRGWGKTAIAVRNVSGFTIQGNEIYSPLGYPEPSLSDRWIAIGLQFNQDVNVVDDELFSNVELIRELHSEII